MNWRIRGHGVQKGDVVHARGKVREQLGDMLAALTILLEGILGPHHSAFILFAAPAERFDWYGFAIQGIKIRFVVKRINLAGPAIHEQEDHALGLAESAHGRLGRQRIREAAGRIGSGSKKATLREHACEGDRSKASSRGVHEIPARASAKVSSMFT